MSHNYIADTTGRAIQVKLIIDTHRMAIQFEERQISLTSENAVSVS